MSGSSDPSAGEGGSPSIPSSPRKIVRICAEVCPSTSVTRRTTVRPEASSAATSRAEACAGIAYSPAFSLDRLPSQRAPARNAQADAIAPFSAKISAMASPPLPRGINTRTGSAWTPGDTYRSASRQVAAAPRSVTKRSAAAAARSFVN